MTRRELVWNGIAATAIIGLAAGCNSIPPQVENTYADNCKESIYRTVEKADSVYRDEQAECVTLFNNAKDHTGFQSSMMHVVLKAGKSLAPWTTQTPLIIYTAKGSGMVKLNRTAYILQEGTGIYAPPNFQVELINNSKAELKLMMLCRNVPNLKWVTPEPPVTFHAGKNAVENLGQDDAKANQEVNQVVPDKSATMAQPNNQPQKLTAGEKEVKTLSQEKFNN
ncbi:MAG: AraC family ligand binding domain-containing protein [Victivallales bacterium]|nr:AraC family ligand binding domain-containing protein [Victivallales bacterium]